MNFAPYLQKRANFCETPWIANDNDKIIFFEHVQTCQNLKFAISSNFKKQKGYYYCYY